MGIRDDLSHVPDDVRTAMHDADESLERTVADKPIVAAALDLRIVLVSVVVAFLIALVLRLVGLPFIVALLVFLLLVGGLWMVLAGAAAPRKPTARTRVREGAQPGAAAGSRD